MKNVTIVLMLLLLSGCAHVKENWLAYTAAGIAITATALHDGGSISTDPCAGIPDFKERQLTLCREHFK